MVEIQKPCAEDVRVKFYREEDVRLNELPEKITKSFRGRHLQNEWLYDSRGQAVLLAGIGKPDQEKIYRKEITAQAVRLCIEKKQNQIAFDMGIMIETYGIDVIRDATEGALLGAYCQKSFAKEKEKDKEPVSVRFFGIPEELQEAAVRLAAETEAVAEGVCFARDMVNCPGNRLRPLDFAREIAEFAGSAGVQTEIIQADKLRNMGMNALLGVGDSSEYPPCLMILRYHGAEENAPIIGLIGKGVTCDTGGYCLKPANSMLGIKGDMAGGAAVSAAVYALAKNKVKTNVIAVVPMCENRISAGSLLPGDVISSYSGKTIEIANTDAEGRLILADAVSYAVRREGVSEVLDIATLTGAVVQMLGFDTAGVISDNEDFYERFAAAFEKSGERYWRLPFHKEQEKMIESKAADIRNMGKSHCGTITAGLFIRAFAESKPWIHLDIAGTAWVDEPIFAFQSAGATGAAVTSLYELCCPEEIE